MKTTQTLDLDAQIAQTREKVAEAVGAIADRIDTDKPPRSKRGPVLALVALVLTGLVLRKFLG